MQCFFLLKNAYLAVCRDFALEFLRANKQILRYTEITYIGIYIYLCNRIVYFGYYTMILYLNCSLNFLSYCFLVVYKTHEMIENVNIVTSLRTFYAYIYL